MVACVCMSQSPAQATDLDDGYDKSGTRAAGSALIIMFETVSYGDAPPYGGRLSTRISSGENQEITLSFFSEIRLFATASISLIRLSWLTSLAPAS
ncbi:hypothetical protein SAMN04487771_10116 [[Clostridium] aminophilum]|uniref:Uncharacterized protein n=1 Tax=[Clostridium] aminophilum TaxID=1526 RepID=A0A1I0D9U9_9FIRM|nr:hypothetical protein SAMN04487771_10116 [[Clostridium] aminophilum]